MAAPKNDGIQYMSTSFDPRLGHVNGEGPGILRRGMTYNECLGPDLCDQEKKFDGKSSDNSGSVSDSDSEENVENSNISNIELEVVEESELGQTQEEQEQKSIYSSFMQCFDPFAQCAGACQKPSEEQESESEKTQKEQESIHKSWMEFLNKTWESWDPLAQCAGACPGEEFLDADLKPDANGVYTCNDARSLCGFIKRTVEKIEKSGGKVFVAFDYDGVLRMTAKDYMHLVESSFKLLQRYGKNWSEIWHAAAHGWAEDPGKVVDQELVDLVNWLEERGIPAIILTQLMTGIVGPMNTTEWRYKDMLKHGFGAFERMWKDKIPDFSMIDVKHNPEDEMSVWGFESGRFPSVFRGIVQASFITKFEALEEFFKVWPGGKDVTHVIFVDDKYSNAQKMAEAFRKKYAKDKKEKIAEFFSWNSEKTQEVIPVFFPSAENKAKEDPQSFAKAEDYIDDLVRRVPPISSSTPDAFATA